MYFIIKKGFSILSFHIATIQFIKAMFGFQKIWGKIQGKENTKEK